MNIEDIIVTITTFIDSYSTVLIAGGAVLLLLILVFGFASSNSKAKKQNRTLESINKELVKEAEVSAKRAENAEKQSQIMEQELRRKIDPIDTFFETTSVSSCAFEAMEEDEEIPIISLDDEDDKGILAEEEKEEAPALTPEPKEETEEIGPDYILRKLREAEADPMDMVTSRSQAQRVKPKNNYNTGRSGKEYTEEELEQLIKE